MLIVWNPLQERHIKMYMLKQSFSMYRFDNEWLTLVFRLDWITIKLDNTKSFDNQADEVYWKIFNFLNDNK